MIRENVMNNFYVAMTKNSFVKNMQHVRTQGTERAIEDTVLVLTCEAFAKWEK